MYVRLCGRLVRAVHIAPFIVQWGVMHGGVRVITGTPVHARRGGVDGAVIKPTVAKPRKKGNLTTPFCHLTVWFMIRYEKIQSEAEMERRRLQARIIQKYATHRIAPPHTHSTPPQTCTTTAAAATACARYVPAAPSSNARNRRRTVARVHGIISTLGWALLWQWCALG